MELKRFLTNKETKLAINELSNQLTKQVTK